MELKKIKYMDTVVSAMENVLKTIKKGDQHILSTIEMVNKKHIEAVRDVRNFAEKNIVSCRIDESSTYNSIFRDIFGFWGDNPIEFLHRDTLTKPKLDRYAFSRQIRGGLYAINDFLRISEPTKKNLVKCPERLRYTLEGYTNIETYKDGTFKIEADEELLNFIKFTRKFIEELDKWEKEKN
jgi:hypothetical protein